MNPRFKALNPYRNRSTGMAFNREKVFAKQCLSGRLNIDCHLSFNRTVKDISGPPTLVEMREWRALRLKQIHAMKPNGTLVL
jgi:hypothetical protein